MTGPEALYHYDRATNCAKIAVERLTGAPGATGGGAAGVQNSLQCAETALKESLEHVRKLLKNGKKP